MAHPHVWVEAAIDVVYDDARSIVMLRQVWTFDEVFTAYAMSGLKKDDKAALDELASRYLKSLESNGFFTEIASGDMKFGVARASARIGDSDRLTLDVELPIKQPLRTDALEMRIYDRNYFVDISLASAASVRLLGAPPQCEAKVDSPQKRIAVDEAFFSALRDEDNWARQFATTIRIGCRD